MVKWILTSIIAAVILGIIFTKKAAGTVGNPNATGLIPPVSNVTGLTWHGVPSAIGPLSPNSIPHGTDGMIA